MGGKRKRDAGAPPKQQILYFSLSSHISKCIIAVEDLQFGVGTGIPFSLPSSLSQSDLQFGGAGIPVKPLSTPTSQTAK